TVPDGMFVSFESVRTGRIERLAGERHGYIEWAGTPDMVLEIVSDNSVQKDTVLLRSLYWKAGIPEYWLGDARSEPIHFSILHRGPRGYKSRRPSGGWVRSDVFDRSFRLTHENDELGDPQFTLSIRK